MDQAVISDGINLMNLHRYRRSHKFLAALSFCIFQVLGGGPGGAQTYDFGYVPVGTTNKLGGFFFPGGSSNGTNIVMTSESIIGPDAADFLMSTNYTGQTLAPPTNYFYSLSFVPHSAGFETAALTNFETPSPPFGAGVTYLQGAGLPANRPGSGPIVPELAPLEQAMTNFLVAHKFGAGTLALMKDSKLVFRQGYGWRDTNFNKVIHPDNLFRLASVTKMLTASSIYKLVGAGIISTNTKIYDYLGIGPWGGTLGDSRITNITVQNLLDHAGGWNQNNPAIGDPVFHTVLISTNMGLNYPAAQSDVISWMFSKPLDFTPGTSNVYCNLGYSLLGRVIEKASGKPYIDYLYENLLANAGLTNILGFTNFVPSRSRPRDLASWEIWYADVPQFLPRSAVDFPTNVTARFIDGADYYESYDSFMGMSASAIGLCHYLQNYLEGYNARVPGSSLSWGYLFYGSLPGASSVLSQNINQNSSTTNGVEFAALFNERDDLVEGANIAAYTAITNAVANITSWPTNGGGMIQWQTTATNVNKTAGNVTVPLVRSGGSTLPVKVSFTTYGITAGSSNFTSISSILNFGAGITNLNITVPILNDHVIDATRQFSLELISSSGGAWLGSNLTCVVNILDTNTPPQFVGPPTFLPDGSLQLQVQSGVGLITSVQSSTNLSSWQNLKTYTNAGGITAVTDTNLGGRNASFYRAVVP